MAESEHPEAADPKPEDPKPEPPADPTPNPEPNPEADPKADAPDEPTADPAGDATGEPKSDPEATTELAKPVEPPAETAPPAGSKAGRVRMLVAIGLAVLVLVGGGVALAVVASRPRPEDIALQQEKAAAREVAQKFALLLEQARNDGAFALAKPDVQALLCASEQDALEQEWQDRESKEILRSYAPTPSSRLSITVKDVKIEGDKGKVTMSGAQENRRTDQDYALVKENSGWKVCGVTFQPPKSASSTRPTTTDSSEPGLGGPGPGPTIPGDDTVPPPWQTTGSDTFSPVPPLTPPSEQPL